jgi:hypothetical protein
MEDTGDTASRMTTTEARAFDETGFALVLQT